MDKSDKDMLENKMEEFLGLTEEAAEIIKELFEPGDTDILLQIDNIIDIVGSINLEQNHKCLHENHDAECNNPRTGDIHEETTCRKHECKCKGYSQEISIPQGACVEKTTVGQNGVSQVCIGNMCMVTACYTIYIKYKTCDGTECNINKSGCVVFSCVPRWAENDYTVHIPNCPQVNSCGCKVTIKGVAKICF